MAVATLQWHPDGTIATPFIRILSSWCRDAAAGRSSRHGAIQPASSLGTAVTLHAAPRCVINISTAMWRHHPPQFQRKQLQSMDLPDLWSMLQVLLCSPYNNLGFRCSESWRRDNDLQAGGLLASSRRGSGDGRNDRRLPWCDKGAGAPLLLSWFNQPLLLFPLFPLHGKYNDPVKESTISAVTTNMKEIATSKTARKIVGANRAGCSIEVRIERAAGRRACRWLSVISASVDVRLIFYSSHCIRSAARIPPARKARKQSREGQGFAYELRERS